ncbi:hypothetical protein WJX81_003195 [Elliptochloris bilobata]|uniref:peptidylprolyl isomerase n=1 Tax=Elliptochloris bilobata TaxID=381761 RepID=A0AAW1RL73_9CHLO
MLVGAVLSAFDTLIPRASLALGFRKELKKRKVAPEEYTALDDGSRVFDSTVGSGAEVTKGTRVKVHYDCVYKGLDVVSSRQSRLLGGNRTISEPFEFVAGAAVAGASPAKIVDTAGGLFTGQGGPTPPPALSTAVLGMRAGGKRSVLVPAELGFGQKGVGEIPPGATFEMRVEVLSAG